MVSMSAAVGPSAGPKAVNSAMHAWAGQFARQQRRREIQTVGHFSWQKSVTPCYPCCPFLIAGGILCRRRGLLGEQRDRGHRCIVQVREWF